MGLCCSFRALTHVGSGGIDKMVRQWDADSGACVREFEGHVSAVTHLALGARWLVSASQDGQVRLWDPRIADPQRACVQQFGVPGGALRALRYVNDATLLTVSADSVVRLWDSVGARMRQQWDASRYGPLLDLLVDSNFEQSFLIPQESGTGVVSLHANAGIAMLPVPEVHAGARRFAGAFFDCAIANIESVTGHELTAAACDATKLVTASGTNGGIAMFYGPRSEPAAAWRSVALSSTNPADEVDEPGASLCLALTDTLLATGHANGGVRLFVPASET